MRLEETSEDCPAAALTAQTRWQEVPGFYLRHHAEHLFQKIHRRHGAREQRSVVRFCELDKIFGYRRMRLKIFFKTNRSLNCSILIYFSIFVYS